MCLLKTISVCDCPASELNRVQADHIMEPLNNPLLVSAALEQEVERSDVKTRT
jgi:hypothetical protein